MAKVAQQQSDCEQREWCEDSLARSLYGGLLRDVLNTPVG
jgi:hypothetical protein